MEKGTRVAHHDGLEATLVSTGDEVDETLRVNATLTRELKKAKAAAATGQLRELRRSLGSVSALAGDLASAARSVAESFDFDEQEYLASGRYAKELLETAEARGVAMFEADERLLCYPSLVRVLPSDAAVEVDRRREKRLRPSVLIEQLSAAQSRPPRFRPEPFLESLSGGYELLVAREGKHGSAVVRLVDVWGVLTLLPGQGRDYSRPEFARDLYLLDRSGTTTTKGGRTVHWHASSGTRGTGTLTTVAQTGQQQRYWGISFSEPA